MHGCFGVARDVLNGLRVPVRLPTGQPELLEHLTQPLALVTRDLVGLTDAACFLIDGGDAFLSRGDQVTERLRVLAALLRRQVEGVVFALERLANAVDR